MEIKTCEAYVLKILEEKENEVLKWKEKADDYFDNILSVGSDLARLLNKLNEGPDNLSNETQKIVKYLSKKYKNFCEDLEGRPFYAPDDWYCYPKPEDFGLDEDGFKQPEYNCMIKEENDCY